MASSPLNAASACLLEHRHRRYGHQLRERKQLSRVRFAKPLVVEAGITAATSTSPAPNRPGVSALIGGANSQSPQLGILTMPASLSGSSLGERIPRRYHLARTNALPLPLLLTILFAFGA